jgi:uncharacterized paraquat-inducible protein A
MSFEEAMIAENNLINTIFEQNCESAMKYFIDTYYDDKHSIAIKALEKQIPQQAMQFDSVEDGLECPNCKSWWRNNDRYCPRCGQRIFKKD